MLIELYRYDAPAILFCYNSVVLMNTNLPENYPSNLKTLADVKRFWAQRLTDMKSSKEDDATIASYMTGVVNNDNFDKWNDESESFSHIFELVAGLEVPGGTPEQRQKEWREVEKELNAFNPLA